jgi:hypothetical protein
MVAGSMRKSVGHRPREHVHKSLATAKEADELPRLRGKATPEGG